MSESVCKCEFVYLPVQNVSCMNFLILVMEESFKKLQKYKSHLSVKVVDVFISV
jgi:hypothetical protein